MKDCKLNLKKYILQVKIKKYVYNNFFLKSLYTRQINCNILIFNILKDKILINILFCKKIIFHSFLSQINWNVTATPLLCFFVKYTKLSLM